MYQVVFFDFVFGDVVGWNFYCQIYFLWGFFWLGYQEWMQYGIGSGYYIGQ